MTSPVSMAAAAAAAVVAQNVYTAQNEVGLITGGRDLNKVEVDPHCVGTLDYPPLDSEWGCCCCMPELPPFCYKRKIGAVYLCCEKMLPNGEKKVLCLLPAGWSFSLVTYGLVYGTSGLAFVACFSNLPTVVAAIYFCVWLFGFMSLACTGCGDPGIFPLYRRPKGPEWRYFARTKSYRPPGITFCSESGFLVEELDHFCPWTGTTIAKKNMCCFQTFLAMIMVTLIATLVMAGAAGSNQAWGHSSRPALRADRAHALVEYSSDGNLVCGTSTWYNVASGRTGYGTLDIKCRDYNHYIKSVEFVDWGLSSGDCGNYETDSTCTTSDTSSAIDWVRKQCEGMKRCRLQPARRKELGDPCPGEHKRLIVQAKCGPHTINQK